MGTSFQLRLLTPDESVFDDQVEAVLVPGENGQFGVLTGHTKFVTTLVAGELRYVQGGQSFKLAISGGFAEVSPAGVTVLADTLERPEQIDLARAETAKKEALAALAKKAELDEAEALHQEARLARSVNRIQLAQSS